jgi:hypothetical protein
MSYSSGHEEAPRLSSSSHIVQLPPTRFDF